MEIYEDNFGQSGDMILSSHLTNMYMEVLYLDMVN